MIGLGRMGSSMARRLARAGHSCVVFDHSDAAVRALAADGATAATSAADLVAKLPVPRVVWMMVPAAAVDALLQSLLPGLSPGDIVIDGGNSHYADDMRREQELKPRGVRYLDVGTSGGLWGLERGYCLMIGGDTQAVQQVEPIFSALAQSADAASITASTAARGFLHVGSSGAGHFVKMVHNGIEYGLMQAYAEGFDILNGKASEALSPQDRFELNLPDIAEVWRRGSVVSSWLLDLAAQALAGERLLERYSGSVADSGEGRWTVEAAIEEAVPAEVLSAALYARFRSRRDHTFGEKLLSAMRFGFGGHVEQPEK
jgi:6-phosphogluconate dehydrogenase